MKKVFIWFFVFVLIGRSSADESVYMVIRDIPVLGKKSEGPAETVWVSGNGAVRIDYPIKGSGGQKTALISDSGVWYYNSVTNTVSFTGGDGFGFLVSPVTYNETLRQLRYGHEIEFMQKYGFTNFPEEVDGVLCDVCEVFADGFLATLYVKAIERVPFQLEIRRDDSERSLVKKIRYSEYEPVRTVPENFFSAPGAVSTRRLPPQVFTNRMELAKWMFQGYYKNPEPDKVEDALTGMNYYQLQTAGAPAFLFFLFEKHPERAEEWVKQTEFFEDWLRQAALEALWLADTPQGKVYLQHIADNPEHRDFKYVVAVLQKNTPYRFLDLPLTEKGVPEKLMAAFSISGDPAYIQKLVSSLGDQQNKTESINVWKNLALIVAMDPSVRRIIHESSSGMSPEMQKAIAAFAALSGKFYDAVDIPSDSPLSTAESNRQEAEFWEHTLVRLWGNPPDQDARRLIAEYSRNFVKSIPSRYYELAEQNRMLSEQIRGALIPFPNNPALLYMQGELHSRLESGLPGDAPVAIESMSGIFDQTVGCADGRALVALICAERTVDYYEGRKNPKGAVWQTNSIAAVFAVLTQGGFSDSARRVAAKHILNVNLGGKSGEYLGTLYTRILDAPSVDSWLRELIAGEIKIAEAWDARGGDYAEYVTREMSYEFKARLWEARKHFTKAWELEPEFPEPAARMIAVCMGEGEKEEMRQWFDRAVALQMDYNSAYNAYRCGIRPRWHGSHREMFHLGRQALKTGRFDTMAPLQYLNCLLEIGQESESVRDMPGKYPELYPLLREFYEKTPKDLSIHLANTFWLGLYAWGARDYKTAESALDGAIHKYQNQELRRLGGWPMLLAEARLANSSCGSTALRAFALEVRGQYKRARELYLQIMQDPAVKEEGIQRFVRDRAEQMRIRAGMESGEWFDITPPEDLAGWTAKTGHTLLLGIWKKMPDNWIVGTPDKQSARLLCNVPIGDDFELRGELDLSEAERLGIIFGYSSVLSQRQCTILIDEKSVSLNRFYSPSGMKKTKAALNKGVNTFHLQVWNKRVTVYINGQKVLSDVDPGSDWWGRGEGKIGMGDADIKNPAAKLKYRNIELRRLQNNPASVSKNEV